MALTSARDILNKKILGTGGVPSADEIPIDIEGLSATKLSVGLEEIVLDINQLSASVLTIGEKVENISSYSTDEHIVGTWVDGSPIYEKYVDESSAPIELRSGTWTNTSLLTGDINLIVDVMAYDANGSAYGYIAANCASTNIRLQSVRSDAITIIGYTISYTKTAAESSKKKTTRKSTK